MVCPFALKGDMDLPLPVWSAIIRHLLSYDIPVKLLASENRRMESCAFYEEDILSGLPLVAQLTELASARLIVGVPNEWMWAATAWQKKLIVLYPDTQPPKRWFWYAHDNFARLLYQMHQLAPPVMLAGLRQLIGMF